MTGQRLSTGFQVKVARGANWLDEYGVWAAKTPNGRLVCLGKKAVEEDADGTITVRPAIVVDPIPSRRVSLEERTLLKLAASYEWPGLPGYCGELIAGVWSPVLR